MADEAERIEAEMRAARQRLANRWTEVHDSAGRWRDWRAHLRAHPVALGAAAALLGYALVPRRRTAVTTRVVRAPAGGSSLASDLLRWGLQLGVQQVVPLLMGMGVERLRQTQADDDACVTPETASSALLRRPR